MLNLFRASTASAASLEEGNAANPSQQAAPESTRSSLYNKYLSGITNITARNSVPLESPSSRPLPRKAMFESGLFASKFWLATNFIFLVGWIVTIAGLGAIAHTAGSAGGLTWFIEVVTLFVWIWMCITISQETAYLWRPTFLMLYLIITIFNLSFAEAWRTVLGAVTTDGLHNAAATYLAGLILQLLVLFPWLMLLSSNEETFPSICGEFTMHRPGGELSYDQYPATIAPSTTAPSATMSMASHAPVSMISQSGVANAGIKTYSRPDTPSASHERPIKVKAMFNYSANPEDPNEVSFEKGQILYVVDNRGKWWQVKREDAGAGAVGIAPSNYLQIIG